jgi:hypothetical protein
MSATGIALREMWNLLNRIFVAERRDFDPGTNAEARRSARGSRRTAKISLRCLGNWAIFRFRRGLAYSTVRI